MKQNVFIFILGYFHWAIYAVAFLIAAALARDVESDDRPNVILMMADDLGYETVGCYGGSSYGTPNLDRLAAQGIRFDRAYAMPLCTNTRIQLMTGKYNLRNWVAFGILAPTETTFGHLMKQAGYKTCIAGKWQLTSYDPPDYPGGANRRNTGMHPCDAGFDEYSLWHVGHTEDKGSRYADPVIEQNGQLLSDTEGQYGPDIWTDFIVDFMRRHREQPFFVYYSMALPHNPMVPTPDSAEWSDPDRRHQDETRLAADMIRYTDKMVGKVVSSVDSMQLGRNTLILFFSDNGTNWRVMSRLGERVVRGGKGKATELGVRVPMMARWTGVIKSGAESQALIDSVDFLPTLLDVASATNLIPESIDGVSFGPILRGESTDTRDWIYIHQDPRPGWDKDRFSLIRLAINRDYKLYEDGRMFDLNKDPFEQSARFVDSDDDKVRAQRELLQGVLDSMQPYALFDPKTVPRPNPNRAFQRHRFQDDGGYFVIEAEDLPVPRDESWLAESHVPGYLGKGYLRALRGQKAAPDKGQTRVAATVDAAGSWRIAVRCRSDHPSSARQNEFWLRVNNGPWLVGRIDDQTLPGKWQWVETLEFPSTKRQADAFQLGERGNDLWIAPRSANIKIDRIVLYQSDQRHRARDLSTPVSAYHPWSRP